MLVARWRGEDSRRDGRVDGGALVWASCSLEKGLLLSCSGLFSAMKFTPEYHVEQKEAADKAGLSFSLCGDSCVDTAVDSYCCYSTEWTRDGNVSPVSWPRKSVCV